MRTVAWRPQRVIPIRCGPRMLPATRRTPIRRTPPPRPRGATITINVVNPTGNPKDWIGIYLVGQASGTKSVVEHYVTWTAGYTIPTTTAPGTYEARLFSNDSLTLLATSAAITVQ